MPELIVQVREILGKKVKSLRAQGLVPAVLYGHSVKGLPLTIQSRDFEKIWPEAGESTIIDLKIHGQTKKVLIHDLARDHLTDKIIHIDFYEVKMDEKIKVHIPLVFVGESAAVKTEEGALVKNIQEVEVEALPQDLPHQIEVDISHLQALGDIIYIKDLKTSAKAKLLAEPDEVVASIVALQKTEEPTKVEAVSAETETAPSEETKPEKPKSEENQE